MNQKVRIIKRLDRKEPEVDQLEQPSPEPARDITNTLKLWVSEFKERRRNNEELARTFNKLMKNAEGVG